MPKRKRNDGKGRVARDGNGTRSVSKSGWIGVLKLPSGRWQAKIKVDNKLTGKYKIKYLGSYNTARQAAEACDEEAIKLSRPLSQLNYPKNAPIGYTPKQQKLRLTNTIGYRGKYSDAVSKCSCNYR